MIGLIVINFLLSMAEFFLLQLCAGKYIFPSLVGEGKNVKVNRQFNPDSKTNKPVAPRYRFIIPTRPLHITAIKKQAVLLQCSYCNIYASTLTRVNSLQRRCLLNDAFLIVRYHQFFMSLKYFPGLHVYA